MPSKLKIGLILDDSLDSSDGVQQYVLTIGRYFTEQGHSVHYLVGQTARRDIKNVHSLSKNIAVRFNGNRMTMPLPASKKAIKRLLDQEMFDVLHVQMPYSPFMAAKVIRQAPRKTVIVGTFHILPYGWLQTAGAKALQMILRPSQRRIRKVWSVSKPAADFAKNLGITSDVMPNAVDLSKFKTSATVTNDVFTIKFLGRLVERKGAWTLLRAIDELVKTNPKTKFKVVVGGGGPELPALTRWAENHELTPVITLTGFVDESAKPEFLADADVAVFPSLGAESFGIVLVEAMAAGAGVVIGGSNPGYSSVLADTPEALFDPMSPHDLATLLNRFMSDASLRTRLHSKQQKMIKQYDVANIGQKLLSCYQELVAKKS